MTAARCPPPLPCSTCRDRVGQVPPLGHPRVVDQDRYHPQSQPEAGLDLQPDGVVGILQPGDPFADRRRLPASADQDQQHSAFSQRVLDDFQEVQSWFDRIHIDEYVRLTEGVDQSIGQPSRDVTAVRPPVADEDPCSAACGRYRHGLLVGRLDREGLLTGGFRRGTVVAFEGVLGSREARVLGLLRKLVVGQHAACLGPFIAVIRSRRTSSSELIH